MAVVKELLKAEANGNISFGNYELDEKAKLPDFEHKGDLYKVKTFKEITKLERNGMFVYESVPGTAVNDFNENDDEMSFTVEGPEDAQVTVEAEDLVDFSIGALQAISRDKYIKKQLGDEGVGYLDLAIDSLKEERSDVPEYEFDIDFIEYVIHCI